ncbi:MAG: hypothetical protein F4Z07_09645 [Dehalococcoidia bacterium]|nr:hypothetical protein [Dehalococcoidia bacterium]
MLFDLLFITLYVLGWLALGFLPWLALSVITRGNAGLRYLPLSMGAGVVGGLAVPFIRDDELGLILSFVVALVLPALLLAAQRLALRLRAEPRGER